VSTSTVINSIKDKSKYLCKTADGYAYGWMAYNRRDASKNYFNKVGEGTLEEASAWMANTNYVPKRYRVTATGPSWINEL